MAKSLDKCELKQKVENMRKKNAIIMTIVMIIVGLVSSGIVMGDRADDETFQTAQTINPGDTKTDSLNEATDIEDYWISNLTQGRLYIINLTGPATADFDLELYDKNEVELDYSWSYDSNEEIGFQTGYTGDYYFRVSTYEGSGPYTLKLFDQGEFVNDGDNTAENATEISLGDNINDDLDKSQGDKEDWYKISLTEGDVVRVNLTVPDTGDFDLVVGNSNLELVAQSTTWENGGYEEVIFGVMNTEYYYILISAWEGAGDYVMTTAKTGTFTPDSDNDPGNATDINVGDTASDSLRENVDSNDWYKITLAENEKIVVKMEVPESGDFDIYLYSDIENYADIGSAKNGMGVDEAFGYTAGTTQDYYIRALAYKGEGNYTLSVTQYNDDNNDDMDNAEEISLPPDTSLEGELIYGLDNKDYYKMELEKDDIVVIDLHYDNNDGNAIIDLYLNNSLNVMMSHSNTSSGHETINFTSTEDGWHYIYLERMLGCADYNMDIEYTSGNAEPVIVATTPTDSDLQVNEGESIMFSISVDDEDIELLDYAWMIDGQYQNGEEGANFQMETTFIGGYDSGDYQITVEVSDEKYTVSATWNLNVMDVNRMPQINIEKPESSEQTINEGDAMDFKIDVTDLDGTNSKLQWILNGEELPGKITSAYTFVSDYEMAGTHIVSVNVTDGMNDTLVNSTSWTIIVLNVDRVPELENEEPYSEDVTIDEETPITFRIDAVDPDGEKVIYEWYVDGELQPNSPGNNHTFIPDYNTADGNIREIKVLVMSEGWVQGDVEAPAHTWNLDITNVNRAPEISEEFTMPSSDMVFKEGQEVEFIVIANDPDGDELQYAWTIDGMDEIFYNQTFKVELPAGNHTVIITITDGDGDMDTQEFWVIVKPKESDSPGFDMVLVSLAVLGMVLVASRKRRH